MVWGLVAAAAAQVISGVVASNSASAGSEQLLTNKN